MYFDRRKYKSFALKQLNGRWGLPIFISIIVIAISSIIDIPQIDRTKNTLNIFRDYWNYLLSINPDEIDNQIILKYYHELKDSMGSFLSRILESLLIGGVTTIFSVATLNFYLPMSKSPEKVPLSAFFEGFADWWRAFLGYAWYLLWTTLWRLLFVIPGIIKGYAYSQMFNLIAEYKNLSVTKAMDISKVITQGHKWELFVLDLSFLGWEILCAFSLGIGLIFLVPYMKMTYINAYHALLKDAIESGKITMEDLQ